MRSVTYSMSASLDGYIVGPDGGFDWSVPDPEVGIPLFAQQGRHVDLELLESRTFDSGVVSLRHRVVR